MLTYQDPLDGNTRLKRRYKWAFWGFIAGMAVGILIATL